jgi:hypothetical protein
MGLDQYEPIAVPAEPPGMRYVVALIGGLVVAALAAVAWAAIGILFDFQAAIIAIGAGFVVGLTVRKLGRTNALAFGVMGALLSLLSIALGNLFTIAALAAREFDAPVLDMLGFLVTNPDVLIDVFAAVFEPIDLLFYGLAIYVGFRTAMDPGQPPQQPQQTMPAA